MISISSIELDNNNRYIFTIRILNEAITLDSESTYDDLRRLDQARNLWKATAEITGIPIKDIYCYAAN